MEVFGCKYGNMWKCPELSKNYSPWIDYAKVSRKKPETFGFGRIYGVIRKCPEHTAGQAILALICKRARISDYQHTHGVMVAEHTLPIVKFRINYICWNPAKLGLKCYRVSQNALSLDMEYHTAEYVST